MQYIYSPVTPRLETLFVQVGNFLKPFTSMFAKLVGQDFGDWAVDTAGGKVSFFASFARLILSQLFYCVSVLVVRFVMVFRVG